MKKILVIDDEKDICLLLERFLKKKGYDCKAVSDEVYGFNLIKRNSYDLVITDLKLPSIDGIDLLKKIKRLSSDTKVIIITGYSDIKTAVSAIKYGAFDYVSKPLYPDELLATVKKALISTNIKVNEIEESESNSKEYVLGSSSSSKKIFDEINLVAPTDMSVIITGETGTGKEFVAKELHRRSDRKKKPFFAIDCGALPNEIAGSELFGHEKGAFTGALSSKDGVFEAANGGTLFLDEIGNLSYDIQIKLLRVLQEKKYRKIGSNTDLDTDVRIIAATNENLSYAVEEGSFRQDLLYRINEFALKVAPLRNRKEDIDTFIHHFIFKANNELGKQVDSVDEETLGLFKSYKWPGNLREMKNVIKRAVLMATSNTITKKCIPEELIYVLDESKNQELDKNNLKDIAQMAERDTILKVLKETGNNKTKAAKLLNIDRKTLYNKLKSFN